MALYEMIYIARQDMNFEAVDVLTEKFEKIISDNGGKVASKEYWGLRKFAYKINKSDRGHYILLNIEADYKTISELNRITSLNEDVVRSLTLNKTSDLNNNTELFVCKNAKDFKTVKTVKKEEKDEKYGNLLQSLQFDN